MRDALQVVVPTIRAPLRGMLRSAHGSAAAVLLINNLGNNPGPQYVGVHRLFTELGLYLQSAGITSLQFTGQAMDTTAHMIDLLGGVSFLRSLGWEHIAVIAAARGEIGAWEMVRGETLANLLTTLRARESSLPNLVTALRNLVSTIRVATESVVGVAMVLAPEQAVGASEASAARRSVARRGSPLRMVDDGAPDDEAIPPPDLPGADVVVPSGLEPALFVQLPDPVDEAREGATSASRPGIPADLAILSRLYLWCRAWVMRGTPAVKAPDQSDEAQQHEGTRAPMPGGGIWPDGDALVSARGVPGEAGHAESMRPASPDGSLLGTLRQPTAVHARLIWLDGEWSRLLQRAGLRDLASVPEGDQAEDASAGTIATEPGWSLHASREMWSLLDGETRIAWLRVCQQAFIGA